MNIYKKGQVESGALEKFIEINPIENANLGALNRLDYLISFCRSKIPEAVNDFIDQAEKQYKNSSSRDLAESYDIDLLELTEDKPCLGENINLARWCLNFYLDQLDLPADFHWKDKKTSVRQGDQIRSFLLPRYLNLIALTESIGREEAISLYKEYTSRYRNDTPVDKRNYSSMEALEQDWIESSKDQNSPWEINFGLIEEGKLAYLNLNCLWVDALIDYKDSEFKYLICCYGDYQGAKAFYDESVLLTMEHTIAEGHPYCSRVLHDTSINWNIKHPDKDFWDKFQANQ